MWKMLFFFSCYFARTYWSTHNLVCKKSFNTECVTALFHWCCADWVCGARSSENYSVFIANMNARVYGINPMKIQKPTSPWKFERPGIWSVFTYLSKAEDKMQHIAPPITKMWHIIYVGLFCICSQHTAYLVRSICYVSH